MDDPHRPQRLNQRQFPRIKLHELLVACQQGIELDLLLVALAAQHHPEILNGRAGTAVIEIDKHGAVAPQNVARVAVTMQRDLRHIQGHGIADVFDQLVEHPEKLLGQPARQPLARRQQLTRFVQHALDVKPNAVMKRLAGTNLMDAAKIAPDPLQLIEVIHLKLATTDALPDGERIALMLQQGFTREGDRGGHRDLCITKPGSILMLFEDLGPAPATRTVELHHIAATLLILKLVDPVLIAVEFDEAGVEPQTAEIERVHDEVGCEIGIVETHVIHHKKGAPLRPILSEIANEYRRWPPHLISIRKL